MRAPVLAFLFGVRFVSQDAVFAVSMLLALGFARFSVVWYRLHSALSRPIHTRNSFRGVSHHVFQLTECMVPAHDGKQQYNVWIPLQRQHSLNEVSVYRIP